MAPTLAWADEEGFPPIFDGKTLGGWDGNPKWWSVEEGIINGHKMIEATGEDLEPRRRSVLLAFQIDRGPSVKVPIKDIRLKRLPKEETKKIVTANPTSNLRERLGKRKLSNGVGQGTATPPSSQGYGNLRRDRDCQRCRRAQEPHRYDREQMRFGLRSGRWEVRR